MIGRALANENNDSLSKPIAILVHGYHPVPGQLDALEEALALHGVQVLRFNYNWKNSLEESADRFVQFVRALEPQFKEVTVIAHSMGGLVARRGMVEGRAVSLGSDNIKIHFISVATPFGGYDSANITRYLPFNLFGIHASQRDLASRSAFIREPGSLSKNVIHTLVETDEMGKVRCRMTACDLHNAKAWVSDAVALPANQLNEKIESDPRVADIYCLNVGHVGVLRGPQGAPSSVLSDLLFANNNKQVSLESRYAQEEDF